MRALITLSDLELVGLLKAGDHAAFAAIYDRYKGLLYVHALKLLKDEDEAQDVIQEVYAALWKNAPHYNEAIPLKAYLYRAVKNKIFDIFSHEKIRSEYVIQFDEIIQKGTWITDEQVRERELIAAIEAGLEQMPPKMREIFELSRFSGMSHKEIAEELNLSDKTVKTQVHNALTILRLKLGSFFCFFLL
ncbi:RNA polymerase sigma factor [Mucilaginibacter ximonensis]|uniref:RNA polymerase sigma factor n=1 Tax=Mucilaginibacter ximonensis TaxID=538021 RepID=A0ABW5Y9J4_9SPHI